MDYFLFLERCSIYVDVSSPTTNEHKKQTILICLGFKTDISEKKPFLVEISRKSNQK